LSAFALTSALVAVSAPARAAIVDFEDKAAFSCNGSGSISNTRMDTPPSATFDIAPEWSETRCDLLTKKHMKLKG